MIVCKYKRSRGFNLITCSREAVTDGYCTQHHPSYISPKTLAAMKRLDNEKPYTVRVTRSTDLEWADIEVKAIDVEEAKTLAIREAVIFENLHFNETPEPSFYIDPMDEPEEPEEEA